jgi:hypothetical protein
MNKKHKYSTIRKGLYNNPKFRNISFMAKGLYLMLRTCQEMNVLGAYIKDKFTMSEFLGFQERRAKKCFTDDEIDGLLKELQDANLIFYQDGLVVIVGYLYEFPLISSYNNILHAVRELATVFEQCPQSAAAALKPIVEIIYESLQDLESGAIGNTVFDYEAEKLAPPFEYFGLDSSGV